MKPIEHLVTHSVRPSADVGEALVDLLPKVQHGEVALAEALKTLDELRAKNPDDPRLEQLVHSLLRLEAVSARMTPDRVQRAFQNLAEQARSIVQAYQGEGRVTRIEGGMLRGADRRMVRAAVKLAEKPLAEGNAPAATVLTLDGKVVAVGLNRAYVPVRIWDAHGELEAFRALEQRIYSGIGQVLLQYRDRGGALDPQTLAMLAKLESQGIREPPVFSDSAAKLEKGGFFAPEKIKTYAQGLRAFTVAKKFTRDEDGKIDPYARQLVQDAVKDRTFRTEELADWSAYDRVHSRAPDAKLNLHSSLEPCGMCMQSATAFGQIGRVMYAASDHDGGGVSSLEHYPNLYFRLGRVPFEVIGGAEAEHAQHMYDQWVHDVYPKVRTGVPR